jgi:hypothetical protein
LISNIKVPCPKNVIVKFPAEVENTSFSNFWDDAFIENKNKISGNEMIINFFIIFFNGFNKNEYKC